MANQIVVSAGAKVRNLQDVIIGTSGVLSSLAFDVANGVPKLDSNGKILVSQLPNSVMEYKGTWNASTNTPTLVNGTGNQGDVYLCNVAGTVNFGAGAIAFVVGDQVIYSGSIWQKASGATGTVTSVAVTESGDSLSITGSPITTSGTINIGFNGTNLQYVNGAGNLTTFPILTGYVTAVSGTAPVVSSGGTTPAISMAAATGLVNGYLTATDFAIFNAKQSALTFSSPLVNTSGTISIPAATSSVNGYLASADWSVFNAKQNALTLTTTGSSGAATLIGATLNIPNYGSVLTGYVPYTGATQDVDLGAFKLNAQSLHIKGTAGNGHLGLKHQSASATASANEVSLFADSLGDLSWLNGNLYLSKFITSGNTAARSYTFPNLTGTIALTSDLSAYVTLATTQTISGAKTFSGGVTFSSSVTTNNLTFANSGFFLTLQPPTLSVNRTVTLPNGTGTLALTSDISYPVTSVFGRTGAVVATSGDYTTTQVTEGTNLYFTDAKARLAISLTTTGSSGVSTYNSTTGVLNIPNYGSALSGYLPLSGGTLTGALTITNARLNLNGNASDGKAIMTLGDATYPTATIGAFNTGGTVLIAGQTGTGMTIGTSGQATFTGALNGTSATFSNTTDARVKTIGTTNLSLYESANTSGSLYVGIDNSTGSGFGVGNYSRVIWSSGTGYPLIFATQDVERMRIWGSTGNVNIGTTPASDSGYKLDVNGTGRFSGALSGTSASFSGNGSFGSGNSDVTITIPTNNGGAGWAGRILGRNATGQLVIQHRDNSATFVDAITISSGGGTPVVSLGGTLNVAGAATFSSSVTATSFTVGNGQYFQARRSSGNALINVLGFETDDLVQVFSNSWKLRGTGGVGDEKITVTSSGAATFSSSVTATVLAVNGFGDSANQYITLRPSFIPSTSGGVGFMAVDHSGSSTDGLACYGHDGISFYTAQTERMRITSGGALCLGVTSAYGTNLLNVNGGIYATSSIAAVVAADLDMLVFQNTGATYSKACVVASMTATGGTGSYFFYGQQSTSTAAIKIFSNGNIQNTNNSYGAISDARLKENIKDATPKLDDLMKVKVRNYNLKGESNKQLGVISQELEAIFPNMIEESTNMGENMKIKGIKYSVFVPMLIKAMQELKAEIEILKNK